MTTTVLQFTLELPHCAQSYSFTHCGWIHSLKSHYGSWLRRRFVENDRSATEPCARSSPKKLTKTYHAKRPQRRRARRNGCFRRLHKGLTDFIKHCISFKMFRLTKRLSYRGCLKSKRCQYPQIWNLGNWQLCWGINTYLQWTIIGPAIGMDCCLEFTSWTICNTVLGSLGTPWSGQPV